jgi:NADH:ubiquinone oxidoreductase subunit F (NADH-binding)
MIVPSLLEIQERYGFLPLAELEFLALRAGVPLYRVQELTTFFPHFRHSPPPRVSVHVCQSMTCHLRGAPELLRKAKELAGDQVEVHGVSCLGRCDRAPACLIGQHAHEGNGGHHGEMLFCDLGSRHQLPALIHDALAGKQLQPDHDKRTDARPDWQIDVYGPSNPAPPEPYAAVKKFLGGELDAAKVIKMVKEAGLMGMGGAAASTFRKWQEVRDARGETRYIICNADESEPGTFKDRELMLRTPHLLIEGMLLCGLTVGASRGYIYTRHEYPEQIAACNAEIKRAAAIVPEAMRRCPLETFTSPGLYICGEESALIEVIEGKRAQPRNQPPTIRENGLFDMPTVVNNVETYSWAPAILLRQEGWYRFNPLRFFSISGDVKRPGVYEVSFSTTLGELIDKAGGIADGLELYAAAMSGPSGGFVPAAFSQTQSGALMRGVERAVNFSDEGADHTMGGYDPSASVYQWRKGLPEARVKQVVLRDLPLNVQAFRAMSLSLGAAIVIYGARPGQKRSMLDLTLNTLQFFEKESCGKCVPCRLGCQQLAHFATELMDDRLSLPQVQSSVETVAGVMKVASICGLGRAASVPFSTWLQYFAAEKAGNSQ